MKFYSLLKSFLMNDSSRLNFYKTTDLKSSNLSSYSRLTPNFKLSGGLTLSTYKTPSDTNFSFWYYLSAIRAYLSDLNFKTFSYGFMYLRGLFVILFVDACLTDDEPL
jgi:hypothetical protein